ncbi:MAG: hypothetical protein Q7S40_13240 [Opitutaceae bacterium]|nr:hypothetical protein [Opitutaceae bacterium]
MSTLTPRPPQRGSLLIVAMIMCAVIGISIVSYIQLGRTALTLSNRGIYNNAAMNLAEQGLEEAMYSVNKIVADPSYTMSDWNTNASVNKRRRWDDVALSQNAEGEYRVYVYNYAGSPGTPKIVSKASIRLGGSSAPAVEKWIEVQLLKTSKFANGLVAKTSVSFTGNNATVDSWNSDPENDGAGIRPYSTALQTDNGSVGSISISTDAVVVQNADVWGYVATGGTDPTTFVGSNGSILGNGSPGGSNVDPNRVSTNFCATFDPVTSPTTTSNGFVTLPPTLVLPDPSHIAAADGYYYYDAAEISLSGGQTLTINNKKVVLRVTGNVTTTGNAGITLSGSDASLAIYTPGTVDLGGNGVANGTDTDGDGKIETGETLGQPINFQIWGTSSTAQNISIHGNGLFSGVIYAPNGNVSIVGNGSVCGSIVANNIALSGTAEFHYDESLAKVDGGNPYRVGSWKELTTSAARSIYSGVLDW